MKIRSAVAVLAFVALTAADAAAQGVVVRERPLDSERAAVKSAVLTYRDTLQLVHAAAARLGRDFQSTSTASLVGRARMMRDACAASLRALEPARAAFKVGPAPSALAKRRQADLLTSMEALRAGMRRCDTEFTKLSAKDQGEQVRGYGNARAVEAKASVRGYERALALYLASIQVKIRPLGADNAPLAG